ncbi:MAG: hypothetical protein IPJ34_32710 [Myxococcales bacterium]|nr:hypothetical protein [Myxococcales bacterium]
MSAPAYACTGAPGFVRMDDDDAATGGAEAVVDAEPEAVPTCASGALPVAACKSSGESRSAATRQPDAPRTSSPLRGRPGITWPSP